MSAPSLMAAVLLLASSMEAQSTQTTLAPTYSTASIANAATNIPAGFAPNSIVSIYGSNLAFTMSSVSSSQSGILPTTVAGVTVYIGLTPGYVFFVSPQQINVLIPYNLVAGPTSITVLRQGTAGPTIPIVLTATAPGLFELQPGAIIATHADGSLITTAAPATAGEIVIIYAIGLGPTIPEQNDGVIPARAAPIANLAGLNVLLNGTAVDHSLIQYAGITPGCAGLYQINLLLPTPLAHDPEVRVQIGPQVSPAGMSLLTQ